MKTFIVPCFVVVEADSPDEAEGKVRLIQMKNRSPFLYQDEGLPIKEVPPDIEYYSLRDFYSYDELVTGDLDEEET